MKLVLSDKQATELMRILMEPGTRVAAFRLDTPYEKLAHTACLWEIIDLLSMEVEWPLD